ncbi:histidine kinase [Kineosporia rhizophila]|uniref:sensor histidine kinase n=1 Tax=Kineosporia TaxID=49184 RepID=UPI001E476D54|nr:histidine kinase [Kineosporia sp. NBRC 101677]MCE0537060.1 histidine kinase [Kineosporia rhizophila]
MRRSRDVLLAVVLTVASLVPGNGTFGVALGNQDLRDQDADPLSFFLILAQCLPLALRHRRPGLCLALVGPAVGIYQLLGYQPTSAGLSLYVALYSAGAHLARRRALVAAAAVAGYVVVAVAMQHTPYAERPVDSLTFFVALSLFWVVGEGLRARARAEAERRVALEREAVAAERARIARELHDVVTHHVTAMVVQSEALPFLLPDRPDGVRDGLATISRTGRSAMTDLRELLDVLHDPGTPPGEEADRTPAHEPLETLIERARSAGQTIEFTHQGDTDPLPTGLTLALHRVVQEALTNALKHAPGCPISVTLAQTSDAVQVDIVTAASSAKAAPRRPWARSGRGINGMRDRVTAFGGELTAGPEPDGSFVVRARLPRKLTV